jgi:predicted RNA binding protein YcfA (HicA-like mRNA interferase family)
MKNNELFRLLQSVDLFIRRQTCSIMRHPIKPNQLTVPNHGNKAVKKGMLSTILKQAKIKTPKR